MDSVQRANMENMISSSIISPELALPGFRFQPTDEELVDYYLKETAVGTSLHNSQMINNMIGFVNIYEHQPWDLPAMAMVGEREWYFFVAPDKRNGGKPNRTTDKGYWKATGSHRPIRGLHRPHKLLGLRKTLVFYTGKAPKGRRTDWVMNEYSLISTNIPQPQAQDIVLCKIYRKATSFKVLERMAQQQYAPSTSYHAQNNYFEAPLMSHSQDLHYIYYENI